MTMLASEEDAASSLEPATPTSSSTISNRDSTNTDRGNTSAVPFEGNTYIICERSNSKAIAQRRDKTLYLRSSLVPHDDSAHWLCTNSRGYFVFQNLHTGCYLGHERGNGITGQATSIRGWELFIIRRHPRGGCQLLTKYGWDVLWAVTVEQGELRRQEATSDTYIWDFMEV